MVSNSTEFWNPVHRHDSPDPFVVRLKDGSYMAWTTQVKNGDRFWHMPQLSSRDLVNWRSVGDALPNKSELSEGVDLTMAPHGIKSPDGTVLAYIASGIHPDKGDGHGIYIATASHWRGVFKPAQEMLVGGQEPGFRHIDPMVFVDPATNIPYLVWGSAGFPILMQELSADFRQLAPGSSAREIFNPPRELGGGVVEAAWIYYDRYAPRGRQYVMYFSFGDCFGKVNQYQVGFAVADTPRGPYQFMGLAIENGDEFTNAGHHGFVVREDGQLVTDSQGNLPVLMHAIPTQVSREKPYQFVPRNLVLALFERNRMRYGADGPPLGGVVQMKVAIDASLTGQQSRVRQAQPLAA